MYDPVKDGIDRSVTSVSYVEVAPPERLRQFVHCFWEMKPVAELVEDFVLHALPDACTNLLFDQVDLRVAGVTALATNHTTLNLGTEFHYVGVQLYPGVWQGDPEASADRYVGEPYVGALPMREVNNRLGGLGFDRQQEVLADFVDELIDEGLIVANPTTAAILDRIGGIRSVADMAAAANLSTRQLQRTLQATTGFRPHDLLKVLRLQHSFRQDYLLAFTDQAHYTRAFRDATGYTPARFHKTFDVD